MRKYETCGDKNLWKMSFEPRVERKLRVCVCDKRDKLGEKAIRRGAFRFRVVYYCTVRYIG